MPPTGLASLTTTVATAGGAGAPAVLVVFELESPLSSPPDFAITKPTTRTTTASPSSAMRWLPDMCWFLLVALGWTEAELRFRPEQAAGGRRGDAPPPCARRSDGARTARAPQPAAAAGAAPRAARAPPAPRSRAARARRASPRGRRAAPRAGRRHRSVRRRRSAARSAPG